MLHDALFTLLHEPLRRTRSAADAHRAHLGLNLLELRLHIVHAEVEQQVDGLVAQALRLVAFGLQLRLLVVGADASREE